MLRHLIVAAFAAFFVFAVAASGADTLEVRLMSQTATTVTLGWDPQPGFGYLFSADGALVSRTNDPSRSTVKFSKSYSSYEVAVIVKGLTGSYPPVEPPPPPPPAVCANGLDDDQDGKIDYPADPGCSSATDDSETDPVPPPAACADGLDNDGDGRVDYPADPGCSSSTDTDETDAAPPAGAANLYVDTSGGTCTRSASPVAYVDSAACGSFAAAYTAAQSGDVVGVTGSLGSQFFAGGYLATQGRGTKTLTFRGEPGNKVRQIHFGSPNLTFDGINVDASNAMLGGSDGALFENGGEPFVFKNGSIGNVRDQKGALVDGPGIVFDNVRFHDVVLATDGVHNECIFAEVPEGMVIRNSTFTNCAVMDIFFVYPDWWSPLPPVYGNVVLEGNRFGQPVGTYSLYIAKIGTSIASSAPITGWKIRNNVIDGPVTWDAPMGSGNTFCGNSWAGTPSGWTRAC